MAFVRLACIAKPLIHQRMSGVCHPTSTRPLSLQTVFHQVIWTHSAVLPTTQEIRAFNRHGLARGIGA
jgi:hypothetical protein